MKCLSLTQPWAWSMMHGPKEIENRTWAADWMVGQTFGLHASAKWDKHGEMFLLEKGVLVPPRSVLPQGALLGTVKMERCIELAKYEISDDERKRELVPDPDQEQFFFGPFGFYLPNAHRRPITPIPMNGMLGFFELAPDVVVELESRLRSGLCDTLPSPLMPQQTMPWEPPRGLHRPPRKSGAKRKR